MTFLSTPKATARSTCSFGVRSESSLSYPLSGINPSRPSVYSIIVKVRLGLSAT